MKKIISLLGVLLLYINIISAQIKEVGNDYARSLTGAQKYYEQDINFERLFSKTAKKRLGLSPYPTADELRFNMIGDTIYIRQTLPANQKNTFLATQDSIKKGYYIITGYVFCNENWEKVKKAYNLYEDFVKFSGEDYSIKRLKEDLLHEDFDNLKHYLLYVVLTSIEKGDDPPCKVFLRAFTFPLYYDYLAENGDITIKPKFNGNELPRSFQYLLYTRYFNEIRNYFLEQEVYFIHCEGEKAHRVMVDECDVLYGYDCNSDKSRIIYDDIRREKIRLLDQKYKVKDVILTSNGTVCCVLEGAKTGSFAVTIPLMGYAFSTDLELNSGCWNIKNYKSPVCRDKSYVFSSVPGDIPYLLTSNAANGHQFQSDYNYMLLKTGDYIIMERRRLNKQKAQRKEAQLVKQATMATYVAKYGSEYGEYVAQKRVAVGMTKDMCRDAWGWPMNTYSTTTSFGNSEVWCYNYKTRVYFYNGKVVQIDN